MLTPLSRKTILNSDLDKNLSRSPVNSDILRLIDEEAIKESIRNLLLTDKGERLFQPKLGGNIKRMLFENITPDIIVIFKDVIKEVLKSYEPRINLIGVDILSGIDDNSVNIFIIFNIQSKETPITLEFILNRTR